MSTPLANIYSTSVMEHHHLYLLNIFKKYIFLIFSNQTVTILQQVLM